MECLASFFGKCTAPPPPPPLLAAREYFDVDTLLESVASGAIRPLRGRWIVEQHRAGKLAKLDRRQDLPDDVFWSTDELRWLALKLGDEFGWLFVALSYRWLSAEHPDPDGFHLNIVASVSALYLNMAGGKSLGGAAAFPSALTAAFQQHGLRADRTDFALFWDFAALHQPPRTETEEALFEEGLQLSGVWFGHTETTCWLQSELPRHLTRGSKAAAAYDASGWCSTEAAISAVVKPAVRCLDLARRTKSAMDVAYGPDGPSNEACRLTHTCMRRRLPPPAPEELERAMRTQKHFAHAADVGKVTELYETFLEKVAEEVDRLAFRNSGWVAAQAVALRDVVMPRFPGVAALDLGENSLGASGAKAVAAALCSSLALTSVDLSWNGIGPAGATCMSEAIQWHPALTAVSLLGNGLDDDAVARLLAVKAAKRSPRLLTLCGLAAGQTEVHLARARLTAQDAKLLAPELSDASARAPVTSLDLHGNLLRYEGAHAIADALRARGCGVTALDIGDNKIGAAAALDLVGACAERERDRPMASIGLAGCSLGVRGAHAVAALVRASAALVSLNVFDNAIGPEGAKALSEALRAHGGSLTHLDAQYNDMGEEGETALREAAKQVQAGGRHFELEV